MNTKTFLELRENYIKEKTLSDLDFSENKSYKNLITSELALIDWIEKNLSSEKIKLLCQLSRKNHMLIKQMIKIILRLDPKTIN